MEGAALSNAVYGAVFTVAALLCVGAVHAARLVSLRWGAVDRGGGRRVHQGEVPRLGGLGIYAVWATLTILALAVCNDTEQGRKITGILLGALLLLAVGVYDDIRSAGVKLKLAAQVAAAFLVYLFGVRIDVLTNPVGALFRLGWLELPLTVFWLVVITNAFNLIDGIDGLAATTGITICAGMALLYMGPDSLGRLTIVILAGALVGFLRHNFPPARIFMGDSGSQSVGFLLGAFSLLSFAKATTLAALVLPIIVFGHPLVDTAYAVLRRYHRGQSLGLADREHIHHLLLDRGHSHRSALGILVVLNLGLLTLVLFLANLKLPGIVVIIALLMIPAGVLFRIARHVLAGGSVREEALAFFMNGERRRVLHQARLFRRAAPAAGSRAKLAELIGAFARETELVGVRIVLRGPEHNELSLFGDDTPVAGNHVRVCVTLGRKGSRVEQLEVSVNRDSEGLRCLSDAAGALADGVRGYLERSAAATGSAEELDTAAAPTRPAERPGDAAADVSFIDTRGCGSL